MIIRDMTVEFEAKKIMEKQKQDLERSNEELENFAYVASHDLQSPLRHISSYVDMIQNKLALSDDKDIQKWMKYVLDGSASAKELIDGLLTYSRVRGDRKEFKKVDVSKIVERIINESKIIYPNAIIKFNDLPMILGLEILLRQLFQNIIYNALKFTKPGVFPTIQIESKIDDDFCQFSIKDNGIGIEQQHFERIFQIFQRLHMREEYEGTGLGLAICQKVIYLHGGSIWIQSQLGEGTTIYFTLPLYSRIESLYS
jgi:light-regulated signal transduction histidine kinase (bacteriophytochrome)